MQATSTRDGHLYGASRKHARVALVVVTDKEWPEAHQVFAAWGDLVDVSDTGAVTPAPTLTGTTSHLFSSGRATAGPWPPSRTSRVDTIVPSPDMDWIVEIGGEGRILGFQGRPGGSAVWHTAGELMPHYPF